MKHVPDKLPDDVLDLAAAQLRAAPVPDVPPHLLAAAAEAVSARAREGGAFQMKKGFPMKRILRIAALIAIAAGIAALIGHLTIGTGATTVAWADVQNHIRSIQTMSFAMTMQMPNQPEMRMTMKIKEPGLMRQDMDSPQEAHNIFNMQQEMGVMLVPAQKAAVRMSFAGLDPAMKKKMDEQDFSQSFKKMLGENATEIGVREIDGRKAKGFHLVQGPMASMGMKNIEIWVDAATGAPVEMSMEFGPGKAKYTDFRFNEPMDDSLFSLEIPEGYEVKEMSIQVGPATAEDVVLVLKMWTKARGGTFPDSLDPANFGQDVQGAKDHGLEKPNEQEMMDFTQAFTRFLMMTQKPEAKVTYAGAGVMLGDAATPIFWYKPEGSQTYKVIYGDLHVTDVAEADLPAKPATKPATAPATQEGSIDSQKQ